VIIGFAGFGLRIESDSVELLDLVRECYAGFSEGSESMRLKAVVDRPRPTGSPASAQGSAVDIQADGSRITLRSADFGALIDLQQREIVTQQPCTVYPIDVCLKVAYAALYSEHRGFLIHAAGVERDGKAYVFFGPPGSGKSTIGRLLGHRLLADELVAIRRAGESFLVSGTPFWGGTDITVPLGGIFGLRQAASTSIVPLHRAEVARRALREVQAPGADSTAPAGIFQDCCDAAGTVPCAELAFNLDAQSIWRAVDSAK
jgi:hypothetical protein